MGEPVLHRVRLRPPGQRNPGRPELALRLRPPRLRRARVAGRDGQVPRGRAQARPRGHARDHGHALRRSVAPDALRADECAGDLRLPGHAPAVVDPRSGFTGYRRRRDGVVPWMGADGLQDEGWLRAGQLRQHRSLSPWTKDKLSAEDYRRKEAVELKNGRLAMLACIGLWAQELVQGGQPVMFTLLEKVATYEIPALFQEFHQ